MYLVVSSLYVLCFFSFDRLVPVQIFHSLSSMWTPKCWYSGNYELVSEMVRCLF